MNIHLDQNNKMIRIPKIGWIKFRDEYKFNNLIKIYNITISKNSSGKYFASISAEVDIEIFAKTKKNCGIDLRLKNFCILSDGTKFNNPKFLVKILKLKILILENGLVQNVTNIMIEILMPLKIFLIKD